MANVNDYIKNYGNISFTEKPFCDADAVAICYATYMPFCQAVNADINEEPVPFSKACRDLFAIRGNKHNISVQMMKMAESKRFYEMKMTGCEMCFEREPAVQFNASTFLLPDGKIVINFQGTDDTLIGWLEDLDILVREEVPSQPLAVEYIKKVAEKYDGDIILCGHSKGGFVAQSCALNCPKEIRDRIIALYNLEGPGFADFEHLNSEAYAELLPKYKHFVPQSSLIGMMLSHDDDYTVIKSNRLTGPMEHELSTWQIDGDALVTCSELTKTGKISDLVMYDVVTKIPREQVDAVGKAVGSVVDGMNQHGLLDVKSHVGASLKGGKAAWKALDDETKEECKKAVKFMKASLKASSKAVKKCEYKSIKERLEDSE